MKNILITEKPSVAMEFSKVLKENGIRKNGYIESTNWVITWCVGHLVTMSYPEKYDEKLKYWRLDTLPFMPKEYKYEIIPSVEKQYNIIKELITRDDIDCVYVATDSGREGEYIYRLVEMQIGIKNKQRRRVWIDSQTEEEIKRGIEQAKPLEEYNSLSDSAYLRAKEDYLIGINFSRLLSIIYGKRLAKDLGEEIKRGIEQAKPLEEYNSLSDSAYLRAKEDYLIGINFSRLLSIIYGKRLAKDLGEEKISISVGRVMTCVLGMVVSREREIRNFVKTPYYKIVGHFGEAENIFSAEWKVDEKSIMWDSPKLYNDAGFKQEKDAKEFINTFQEKKAVVKEVKKNKTKEKAPLLFNLAEIQNECTKRFKIKPDETLEIIQNLYEKKLVTYPRTDARVLSTAVAKVISKNLNGIAKGFKNEEIQTYIRKMVDEKYSTDLIKTKYVDDSKITDHYAIIPTGQGYENYDKLLDLHKQIYALIVKRFLSIFYPPAEFSKISVEIDIENEQFFTSGKVCTSLGYLEILKDSQKENSQENLEILNKLKKSQNIEIANFEIKTSETTPPSRYNSGSIILAMENAGKLIEDEELREQIKGAGIGTSATRAEIIKKLERINYISINSKTQIITPTIKRRKNI